MALISFILVANVLEHHLSRASISAFLLVITGRFEFQLIRDAIRRFGET